MLDLIKQLTGQRVALVVAHQDDESLWFGGLLTSLADRAAIRIISVTKPAPNRPDTNTRLEAIEKVADIVGAEHVYLAFEDCASDAEPTELDWDVFRTSMNLWLADFCPDCIVTHGMAGEPCSVYPNGHVKHKQVSLLTNRYAAAANITQYCRAADGIPGQWIVEYNREAKKRLLDCYAPQWSPDNYPWSETEYYE